jgi:hypothetical protein
LPEILVLPVEPDQHPRTLIPKFTGSLFTYGFVPVKIGPKAGSTEASGFGPKAGSTEAFKFGPKAVFIVVGGREKN